MITEQVERTAEKPRPVLPAKESYPHSPARPPAAPPKPTGGFSPWAILVSLVILAAVGVGGYVIVARLLHGNNAGAAGAMRGGAVQVLTDPVTRGDMPVYFTGLGTVTAYNTVGIKARVDGEIMRVAFSEGDMVKQGQPLIEIDPRPYEAQLEQYQGQLQRDQALLDNANRDLQRYISIPNSVTEQQITTQKALVAQYSGSVGVDKGQIDSVKVNLAYCTILAPFDGRIGLRLIDVGNIVHAADTTALAVVTQLKPITVIFTVTQEQISDVFALPNHGANLPVEAFNRDFTKKLATGKLLAIDNQVDPTTATVRIKAEFANEDLRLFPNQFVNARLLVNTQKDVVLAPSAAVQLGPDSSFVYVVKADKTVELRNVKAGHREGAQTVIEEGLKPGEIVVTDGVDKLTQGAKVNPNPAGQHGTTRPAHLESNGASTQSAAEHSEAGEPK